MADSHAHPLHWPPERRRTPYRDCSPFKATFTEARDGIIRELNVMKASHIVISTNVTLRRDGLPYANLPDPRDPGVAVYFMHKKKHYAFACDRWTKVKDNLRAIEKTIGAIRGLERWGTGEMVSAAFSGFAALPPKGDHWSFTLNVSPHANTEEIRAAYKREAQERHPDKGGSHEEFLALNKALSEALKDAPKTDQHR